MRNKNYIEVKINNKSYGKYKGRSFFVTKELKKELEGIKLKDGRTLFDVFLQFGPTGGKYLCEIIESHLGQEFKLILSNDIDEIKDTMVMINYSRFRKLLQNRFWPLRRENGIAGTSEYLKEVFPKEFREIEMEPSQKTTEQVIQNLPKVIKTKKQRQDVFYQIARMLRESGKKPENIKKLFTSESLKEIRAASNQSFYKQRFAEFKKRLLEEYPETRGKDSWQKWIYKNTWMFGLNYIKPIEKQRVGLRGAIPDYLFPSIDGFLDVLEIKLPTDEVIQRDQSHPGAYFWSPKAAAAVGQVVNYLSQIELHQLVLKQEIERIYTLRISTIKPRAMILIGSYDGWSEEKREGLRKLNYALHGVEILTYSNLQTRAEMLIQIYDKEL